MAILGKTGVMLAIETDTKVITLSKCLQIIKAMQALKALHYPALSISAIVLIKIIQ